MSRIPRPTLTGVIAVMALAFSLSGGAIAKIADKDEVAVQIATGGPTTSQPPGEEDPGFKTTPIPLQNGTFTQAAGQVALISVVADISGVAQETAHCDIEVDVTAGGAVMNELFLNAFQLARRGDPGLLADSDALTAPAADRQVSLEAAVTQSELQETEEEEDFGCEDEIATVSVRISVVTLQD